METIERYLRSSHTHQTANNYIYTIKHFLAIHTKAEMFSYNDIIMYMESLTRKGLKDQTRSRILAAIKRYYDFLMETGVRQDHPCRKLVVRNNRKNIQVQDLFSHEELEMLFSRPNRYRLLDIRNKVLLSLMIYQGLSSEEIVRLTINNIDIDQGTVYVKASKRYKSRLLELHRTQFSLFYEYINDIRPKLQRESTHKLVLGKLGAPISVDGIHSMIEPLKSLFPDRNLSPKTIRQSVISNWLNDRKIPLEDVQDLAGHHYPSATERYKRIDVDDKREWVNKFHPFE